MLGTRRRPLAPLPTWEERQDTLMILKGNGILAWNNESIGLWWYGALWMHWDTVAQSQPGNIDFERSFFLTFFHGWMRYLPSGGFGGYGHGHNYGQYRRVGGYSDTRWKKTLFGNSLNLSPLWQFSKHFHHLAIFQTCPQATILLLCLCCIFDHWGHCNRGNIGHLQALKGSGFSISGRVG